MKDTHHTYHCPASSPPAGLMQQLVDSAPETCEIKDTVGTSSWMINVKYVSLVEVLAP